MIVLDLPAPPSVNRMSRNKLGIPLGNRSPAVEKWRLECDAELFVAHWRTKTIKRPFEIGIIITKGRGDLDNHVKPLLDYLQSREFIENDKLCDKITIAWGKTKLGCQITLI